MGEASVLPADLEVEGVEDSEAVRLCGDCA